MRVIGAAFGIEGRLDLNDSRAKPLHHCLDDVIATDTQASARDLGWQMPVAKVPRDTDQMLWIAATNFNERLGRRDDLDQSSIVKHQRVTAAQSDRIFQIEQEFQSARTGHRDAPAVTVVEVEHDGISRRLRPAMLPANMRGADHVALLMPLSKHNLAHLDLFGRNNLDPRRR
jgi:hypothetical protein